jgi:ketosteroid isomerase-like protein
MTQENVDKARNFIEAYNRRDFDAALESFDPDVDWVLPAHQSSDSARGTAAVRRFFAELDENLEELRLEALEYVEAGDQVATRLRYYGRGKASGVEIETEMYHQVATFRDGVIVRMEYVTSWPAALEALGLEAR